jgi:molybdopterin converting factor small subunit
MPKVEFTGHLRRYLDASALEVEGATVGAALEAVFAARPMLRGYVLDEQGALRRHVSVYVNGDRADLSGAVGPQDEIYVLQALTGGFGDA